MTFHCAAWACCRWWCPAAGSRRTCWMAGSRPSGGAVRRKLHQHKRKRQPRSQPTPPSRAPEPAGPRMAGDRTMTAIERPQYTQGQTLGAADFRAEQLYQRNGRRRHLLGPHTWGIVLGLDLVGQPNPVDPTVVDIMLRPGLATDGYGRELMIDSALRLDPGAFSAFSDLAHRAVYLAYDEITSGHDANRYDDCLPGRQTRVTEGYRIVVDPTPPTHDDVDIAGQPGAVVPPGGSLPPGSVAIPDDESIPYQTLPDSAAARWLVRL